MAIRRIKTSERVAVVYTGDPSIREPNPPADGFDCREATPADRVAGASVFVLRPINATELMGAAQRAAGDGESRLIEMLRIGLLSLEGDPSPPVEVIESLPHAVRIALGRAVNRMSSESVDPFAKPSSG